MPHIILKNRIQVKLKDGDHVFHRELSWSGWMPELALWFSNLCVYCFRWFSNFVHLYAMQTYLSAVQFTFVPPKQKQHPSVESVNPLDNTWMYTNVCTCIVCVCVYAKANYSMFLKVTTFNSLKNKTKRCKELTISQITIISNNDNK